MPAIPEFWTAHIAAELDRDVAALFEQNGTRYRCGNTDKAITPDEFAQIRKEIIANATGDPKSLAFQMLRRCEHSPYGSTRCPTCDAAVRLAWGASATRRTLGLPASADVM